MRLRAAGADVLLATGVDTRQTPILRRMRGKIAVFNANVWSIAARSGAVVLDQWGAGWIQDWRLWDVDRIHLTAEGHRRMALAAAAALGLPGADGDDWRVPLPPADPRPFRARWPRRRRGCAASSRPGSAAGCAVGPPVTAGCRSVPSPCCCRAGSPEAAASSTGPGPRRSPRGDRW